MKRTRVIIMGAGGRDFHNFNLLYRHDPGVQVIAFTASQIPFIEQRRYPPELAGPLYPRGIPIHPETELDSLIRKHRITRVVFAYSDIAHLELMHKASLVLAAGADFQLCGPATTMLRCRKPVISVCASRTGCGKSMVTRYLCDIVRSQGSVPVVVRHPMPYGNLAAQVVQRFADRADLTLHGCTIEEREEFEPLLARNVVVYAGVDYRRIMRRAEEEGDVILWDGGNNDFPFVRSDLEIVVVDPLRPGDETAYHPGEANVRRAEVVIINKTNAAPERDVLATEESVRRLNQAARLIRAVSLITVPDPATIKGKRVLVVEDGPTVTHGTMPGGAALAAARRYGAAETIDPRPYAAGSIAQAYATYPHLGPVLPALGYRPEQMAELAATIEAVPCDLVLCGTPVDLGQLLHLGKPIVPVGYELGEDTAAPLAALVAEFLASRRSPPP